MYVKKQKLEKMFLPKNKNWYRMFLTVDHDYVDVSRSFLIKLKISNVIKYSPKIWERIS